VTSASGRTPAGRRLLAAASELFYLQGLNAVGVAAIADAAGVTKKTLNDCFGSKDGVVIAYLSARHEDWRAVLDARLARGPRSPLAVFDSYIDHLQLGDQINGCGFINAAADISKTHLAMDVVRKHKAEVRRRLDDLVSQAVGRWRHTCSIFSKEQSYTPALTATSSPWSPPDNLAQTWSI
jgi:AcrR family transcriptional regulator